MELNPENYDIRDVMAVLEQVENLLFPGEKKERPTISYRIEGGSVRHLFKTALQYIIGFNALIGQIAQTQDIDFLESPTAKAFEEFQTIALERGYQLTIRTSLPASNELLIDRTTKLYRTESIWAEAEFYFYGRVTNAGGKQNANIHLSTDEYGQLIIKTTIKLLEHFEDNILYKTFGVRVIGKQHIQTGELDRSDLRLIELIDYQPKYDEEYLQSLRAKAKTNWLANTDPDQWLREIRGNYD